GELVRKIRSFRPQVITTYDENGGYPHPDHIMTHKITMVAFEGAADTGKYPEAEFGPAWQPLKVYYNQGFNRPRTQALHDALLERGLESPYGDWLKRWAESERTERTLTTHIPCADFFEIRDKALIAHATQIDPDGGWFRVPMEIQKEVWPTEEYELAKSLVDTSLPEDDLFAGNRDNGCHERECKPGIDAPGPPGRGIRQEQGHPRRPRFHRLRGDGPGGVGPDEVDEPAHEPGGLHRGPRAGRRGRADGLRRHQGQERLNRQASTPGISARQTARGSARLPVPAARPGVSRRPAPGTARPPRQAPPPRPGALPPTASTRPAPP